MYQSLSPSQYSSAHSDSVQLVFGSLIVCKSAVAALAWVILVMPDVEAATVAEALLMGIGRPYIRSHIMPYSRTHLHSNRRLGAKMGMPVR